MTATHGRRYAAASFAIPLCFLALVSIVRVGITWGENTVGLAATCAALSALPQLSSSHLDELLKLADEYSSSIASNPYPADAAALSVAVILAEAEPFDSTRIVPIWAPSLTPLRLLASRASDFIDIVIARPSRIVYAAVADIGLLEPVTTRNGDAAFFAPAWALPAALSLNDWRLGRQPTTSTPIAFPADALSRIALVPPVDAMPYQAAASSVFKSGLVSDVGDGGELHAHASAAHCTCSTVLSDGFAGAPYGPDSLYTDGTLGRSFDALAQDAWRSVRAAIGSSRAVVEWPCAPENRVECTCDVAGSQAAMTRWCLARGGAHVLHVVHFVPPAEVTPLFFEGAVGGVNLTRRGSNATKSSGRLSLAIRGWGDIHIANSAPHNIEASVGSLRAALGLKREGDANLSPAEDAALLHRWITVHDAQARGAIEYGLCSPAREARPPYVPTFVAVSAAESLTLLSNAFFILNISSWDDAATLIRAAREALRILRLARYRAEDIAADPLVSSDGFIPWSHLAAIYAPWWIPIAVPVFLSIVGALKTST